MLLNQTGKSLIQHTYENARQARRPAQVIVATDDQRIASEIEQLGGQAVLTDPDLPSGTDRVAAVAKTLPLGTIFVNVQGDEPELPPAAIDQVIDLLEAAPHAVMSTLATPIREESVWRDPARVKVVFGAEGRALYFSRSPIPHVREMSAELFTCDPPQFFLHLGIYAYRREFLLQLAALPPAPQEQLERLEQLRVLHAGYGIQVGITEHALGGIDTAQDYAAFVERYRQGMRKAG